MQQQLLVVGRSNRPNHDTPSMFLFHVRAASSVYFPHEIGRERDR